ncbi:MAG: hypothetical protein RLZZ399_2084 [Verrucomicrobiota bacterium]|jgi:hypothetical protein
MREFLLRWVLVGLVAWLGLRWAVLGELAARAGANEVLDWQCGLAGIWVGFLNALVRPVVLRMRGGEGCWWRLGMSLAAANAVLFWTLQTWVPGLRLWGGATIWGLVAGVTLLSWGGSVVFRASDGRWHWIQYHGKAPPMRSRPPG